MSNPRETPFDRLGGEAAVRNLVERFYDAMERSEPVLTRLHECDEDGKVSRGSRDRFALFLIGWLGGPQDYIATYGHPRLRMRHAPFVIDQPARDRWVRLMDRALDETALPDDVAGVLREFFHGTATFMINRR